MVEGIVRSVSVHEVWECNLEAFDLYQYMSTQWHTGMSGRTGMVYSEAYKRMDELYIRGAENRLNLMNDLRVMEAETLAAMAEKRGK